METSPSPSSHGSNLLSLPWEIVTQIASHLPAQCVISVPAAGTRSQIQETTLTFPSIQGKLCSLNGCAVLNTFLYISINNNNNTFNNCCFFYMNTQLFLCFHWFESLGLIIFFYHLNIFCSSRLHLFDNKYSKTVNIINCSKQFVLWKL